ncbi:MAG: hypothetical protein U5R46_06150 [Gammaproteobacteria bacterium]|nr:hypothetical protein [Gammaproteobacteria bacterium]
MKEAKIKVPKVSGVANPFLNSLQKGDIEKFGSHFSNDPNASASVGDVRARWREFTEFRDQFVCSGCGRNRFVRPDPLDKPVCKSCQIPFAFPEPPGAQ